MHLFLSLDDLKGVETTFLGVALALEDLGGLSTLGCVNSK